MDIKYKMFKDLPPEFMEKIISHSDFTSDEYWILKYSVIGLTNGNGKRFYLMVDNICDRLNISRSKFRYLKDRALAKAYILVVEHLKKLTL